MRRRHVYKLVQQYKRELDRREVSAKPMDARKHFSELSTIQLLRHVRDTLDTIEDLCQHRWRYWWNYGICHRKLGAVQAALNFAGLYTLQEIRSHNSAAR